MTEGRTRNEGFREAIGDPKCNGEKTSRVLLLGNGRRATAYLSSGYFRKFLGNEGVVGYLQLE